MEHDAFAGATAHKHRLTGLQRHVAAPFRKSQAAAAAVIILPSVASTAGTAELS
jgi:hypothetical protein